MGRSLQFLAALPVVLGTVEFIGCAGISRPATSEARLTSKQREFCAAQLHRTEPLPMEYFNPQYPEYALSRRSTGRVQMEAEIDSDGRVVSPRVVSGEPPGVFDRAALRAFSRWRFCPSSTGVKHPNPVSAIMEFRL
jgi:TonB family protein